MPGIVDLKPKKSADVAEKIGATALLFDSNAGRLYELNETAKAFWTLCDGRRSVRDILKIMEPDYDISPERLEDDVAVFVRKLLELNLITADQ